MAIKTVRNDARTVTASLICFDPTQDQPATSGDIASIVYKHMLNSQRHWIFPRKLGHVVYNYLSRGTRTLLHGEKGTGKTTLLHGLGETIKSANWINETQGPSIRKLFSLVDLNYATATHLGATPNESEHAIAEIVLATIERDLRQSPVDQLVAQEKDLHVVRTSTHFAGLRADFSRSQVSVDSLTYEELDSFRSDKQYKQTLQRCEREYQRKAKDLIKTLDFLHGAVAAGIELVVALDNIDPLPPHAKRAVARVAQAISSFTPMKVGLVVACRTEHVSFIRRTLDPGKTWEAPAMPIPDETDTSWDIEKIIQRRVELSKHYSLRSELLLHFNKQEGPVFLEELDRSVAQVSTTIKELWSVAEPDHQKADDRVELARSLVLWHNGNIRDTSQSIVDLSEIRQDPRHLERVAYPTLARRTRNSLYKHLIINKQTGKLYESVRLFSAEREFTGEKLPFFFLKYRLLAHLIYKGSRKIKAIVKTFEKYGIEQDRMLEIINQLAQREYFDAGFLRIEDNNGPLDTVSEADINATVHMLPAGTYLADELVLRCEYLFWNAMDVPECVEHTALLTRQTPERLISAPTEAEKVIASTIFISDYLVKRFKEEHPYLEPGNGWDDSNVQRIQDFRSDFGYDRDNWFLLRLRRSVSAYAAYYGPELELPFQIVEVWDYLDKCGAQLNAVLRNQR